MVPVASPDANDCLPCGCPAQYSGHLSVAGFQVRFSRYLPSCTAGLHCHDEARIILPLCGAFTSDYGRRTIAIAADGALYRPRGQDHVDRYPMLTDCLSLLLPNDASFRVLDEPVVGQHTGLARAARALKAEATGGDAASTLVSEGLAVLIATIVLGRAPLSEGRPQWIGTVREQLDAAGDTLPSLTELARGVEKDPAYVAATFQRVYGVTVGGYARRLKLWQARDRLDASPECSLSEIAQDCGFSDQSHFTRQFRYLFGMPPGAYRARQRPHCA